jgi:PAS domain-containing protein
VTATGSDLEPLRTALDGLRDGVAILDAGWTLRYLNPAGAALVGLDAAELVGHQPGRVPQDGEDRRDGGSTIARQGAPPPQFAHLETAGRHRLAGAHMHVGGD